MMSKGKYDTLGSLEDQCEPGSHDTVLKNLLGITTTTDMDKAETVALLQVTESMIETYDKEHRFTADDIRSMHSLWLSGIYPWAGNYRHVMMSKGGFPFAAPQFITALMEEYERAILARHTPCSSTVDSTIAESLAITHVELVLIHPFREGNGRLARLLALLMGLQAGLPMLVFDEMERENREPYFAAVRNGAHRDYRAMADIFLRIIEKSRAEQ